MYNNLKNEKINYLENEKLCLIEFNNNKENKIYFENNNLNNISTLQTINIFNNINFNILNNKILILDLNINIIIQTILKKNYFNKKNNIIYNEIEIKILKIKNNLNLNEFILKNLLNKNNFELYTNNNLKILGIKTIYTNNYDYLIDKIEFKNLNLILNFNENEKLILLIKNKLGFIIDIIISFKFEIFFINLK
jgi:hypothetical protein